MIQSVLRGGQGEMEARREGRETPVAPGAASGGGERKAGDSNRRETAAQASGSVEGGGNQQTCWIRHAFV